MRQRKMWSVILACSMIMGVMAHITPKQTQAAETNCNESDLNMDQTELKESEITQYMDCFLPMPIVGELNGSCWGAADTGARDQDNGLEDKDLSDYCYWDGSIIKDEDTGKYYMFASRWAQNGGHWGSEYDGNLGWRGSKAIRAVSDSLYGPYIDEGPLWPDYYDGAGHNVFALRLSQADPLYGQYKYAVIVSDVGQHGDAVNGTIHLSKNLDGTWTHDGKMNVDTSKFGLSNISMMVRPDGRYEATNRNGDIAVADSIRGPWEVVEQKLWWKVPGMSNENIEDPVIWHSDGLYHCVVNKWDARHAYYLTSEDGICDWKLHPGTAYTPDVMFLSYEDGTKNNWTKLERPGVYIENGTLKAMTFAVIDVQKEEDMPNDTHGSKVIVVPFAGEKLGEFASRKDALESRAGILPAEDSNIQSWQGEEEKNYGGEAFLQLQRNTSQGLFGEGEKANYDYDCKIGYLKYDLSGFDLKEDGSDIDGAYLSLVYMERANGNSAKDRIWICLSESGWTEGTGREDTNGNYADSGALTWQNAPRLSYDTDNIQHSAPMSEEFLMEETQKEITIDITGLLKQFKKNNAEGNIISFALSNQTGDRIRIGSKEAGKKYAAKLSVYKKQEKEILSAERVSVETVLGEMPILPEKVNVAFADGTTGLADVRWDISQKDVQACGEIKISGKIPGYDVKAEGTVRIKYNVNDDSPIAEKVLWENGRFFYIQCGQTPNLPKTVNIQLKDGNTAPFHIKWQELTGELFAEPGIRKIAGTVTGLSDTVIYAKVITDFDETVKDSKAIDMAGNYSIRETFPYVLEEDRKMKLNDIGEMQPEHSIFYQWSDRLIVENCTGHDYGFDYGMYPETNEADPEYLVVRAPFITGFSVRGTAHTQEQAAKSFVFETSSDGTEWQTFMNYEKTKDDSRAGWESRLYTAEGLPEGTHYLKITFPSDETWGFNLNEIRLTANGAKEEEPQQPPADKDETPGKSEPDAQKIPKQGETIISGALEYKVTKSDAKNGTVTVNKLLNKKQAKIEIPETVKKDGVTFRVTSISKKVFQGNKKIKNVTIGANITDIGAKSFYGCKKLKTIIFMGLKAPKAGKQTFTGMKKNCRIIIPKEMSKKEFRKLKKAMKSAGTKVKYNKKSTKK